MALRHFHVDVRDLVSFVHRRGNLVGEGKFHSSDRGVEGTRGHRRLQKSRGDTYEAEVPVLYEVEQGGVLLSIGGRVDGLMPLDPMLVEEIKTVDKRWGGIADPLHFAQLRAYAGILAKQREWAGAQLQLTYLHLENDQTTLFRENATRAELEGFLDNCVGEWLDWLIPEAKRLDERDASLAALEFPFVSPRKGQIELSRVIYRTIRDKGRLFLEAPTGLGKTMGALFPAVKALPLLEDGKIFYLTAKTPARGIAEEALVRLQWAGAKIRGLNLTAKGKICFAESPAGCDPRTCPYALGYYDKIKPALKELLQQDLLNRSAVEAVARKHQVCPFELSLDASNWSDLIIGDFNYAFDPSVRLQRHFDAGVARHVVLVDESHNLVDRSREMYSARLSLDDLTLQTGAAAGPGSSTAKRALSRARGALVSHLENAAAAEGPSSVLPKRDVYNGAIAFEQAPQEFLEELKTAGSRMEMFLAKQEPGKDLSAWLGPFFALQAFLRTAEAFGPGYFTICDIQTGSIKLFCADPRESLKETLKGQRSTVFFSATLSPLDYFRDLLGGEVTDAIRRYDSPFSRDQMQLQILSHDISMKGRGQSLGNVAREVAGHIGRMPGNHLVFCPSRSYLLDLEKELSGLGLTSISQTSTMDEAHREAFLAQFTEGGQLTALAVMGGIFSEGVDLPGKRLLGVTVIGVGLPRLSLERDLIRRHYDKARGLGYDYAYLFPGMQRVIQAIGRLIRTETDCGSALLIDRRFEEHRYRDLFPEWWGSGETGKEDAKT